MNKLAIVLGVLFLAVALVPTALAAEEPMRCDEACMKVYSGARGECLLPKQFTAGMTPYTSYPAAQLCPEGQGTTCWCAIDPSILCDSRCKGLGMDYTSGSCEQSTGTTIAGIASPGYGQTSQVLIYADVPCTSKGANYACKCRKASAEVESALAGLNAAFVWTTTKECNYVGGDAVYQVRVGGAFGGGRGLRVDIGGAAAGSAVAGGEGIPPAGISGTGIFYASRTIPRATVDRLADRAVPIRFTIIPWPTQLLQQAYVQSFAPNYPTDFGSVLSSNVFNDTVVCPEQELPTPILREPLEGPKEINIRQITCNPRASLYENVWHLTDFNSDTAFSFAGGNKGDCRFAFDTVDVYGIEACASPGSVINVSSISIGAAIYKTNTQVGEWPNCTFVSLAELNASVPQKASGLTVGFRYEGSPSLVTLSPFPDVASIDSLNITPSATTTGTDITVVGTVTRKDYSAPGGRLVQCTYEWEGGCYPCVGADCKPDPNKFIGKPNWAFLIPFPGMMFEQIENKTREFLGVSVLPPSSRYEIDILVKGGSSSSAATGKVTAGATGAVTGELTASGAFAGWGVAQGQPVPEPNMKILSVSAVPDSATGKIAVTYEVRNSEFKDVGNFVVQIIVRTLGTPAIQNRYWPQIVYGLKAFETTTQTAEIGPLDTAREYEITVFADYFNNIAETDETDNSKSVSVKFTPAQPVTLPSMTLQECYAQGGTDKAECVIGETHIGNIVGPVLRPKCCKAAPGAPLQIIGDCLAGTVGTDYTCTLPISGGMPPYTWSPNVNLVKELVQRSGLDATLSQNGDKLTISGKPESEATIALVFSITDFTGAKSSDKRISFKISAAPTAALPSMTLQECYAQGGTDKAECVIGETHIGNIVGPVLRPKCCKATPAEISKSCIEELPDIPGFRITPDQIAEFERNCFRLDPVAATTCARDISPDLGSGVDKCYRGLAIRLTPKVPTYTPGGTAMWSQSGVQKVTIDGKNYTAILDAKGDVIGYKNADNPSDTSVYNNNGERIGVYDSSTLKISYDLKKEIMPQECQNMGGEYTLSSDCGSGVKLGKITKDNLEGSCCRAPEKPTSTEEGGTQEFYIRYTLKNAIGITVLDVVNVALSGDAPGWMGPVFTIISGGLAILQPIMALIEFLPLGTLPFFEKGIPCGTGSGLQCGLLGWAIANELKEERCTEGKKVQIEENGVNVTYTETTCTVPYLFVTWFDLSSEPEPDPDKEGPYALYTDECKQVTFLDKWLFNAGWWSLFDFLADQVKNAQIAGQAKERKELSDKLAKVPGCSECVERGVAMGDATSMKSVRESLIDTCEDTDFTSSVYCFDGASYTGTAVSKVVACHPSNITITQESDCESKIKLPTTYTKGKWCAKPIEIGSKFWYSNSQNIQLESIRTESGRCILASDKCDSVTTDGKSWGEEVSSKSAGGDKNVVAATDDTGCSGLDKSEDIVKAAAKTVLSDIKKCEDCAGKDVKSGSRVTATGVWCSNIKKESGIVAKGYCVLDEKDACPALPSTLFSPTFIANYGARFSTIRNAGDCGFYNAILVKQAELSARIAGAAIEQLDDIWNGELVTSFAPKDCKSCMVFTREGAVWCVKAAQAMGPFIEVSPVQPTIGPPTPTVNGGTGTVFRGLCTRNSKECLSVDAIARNSGECDRIDNYVGEANKMPAQKADLLTRLEGLKKEALSKKSVARSVQTKQLFDVLISKIDRAADILSGYSTFQQFDSMRAEILSLNDDLNKIIAQDPELSAALGDKADKIVYEVAMQDCSAIGFPPDGKRAACVRKVENRIEILDIASEGSCPTSHGYYLVRSRSDCEKKVGELAGIVVVPTVVKVLTLSPATITFKGPTDITVSGATGAITCHPSFQGGLLCMQTATNNIQISGTPEYAQTSEFTIMDSSGKSAKLTVIVSAAPEEMMIRDGVQTVSKPADELIYFVNSLDGCPGGFNEILRFTENDDANPFGTNWGTTSARGAIFAKSLRPLDHWLLMCVKSDLASKFHPIVTRVHAWFYLDTLCPSGKYTMGVIVQNENYVWLKTGGNTYSGSEDKYGNALVLCDDEDIVRLQKDKCDSAYWTEAVRFGFDLSGSAYYALPWNTYYGYTLSEGYYPQQLDSIGLNDDKDVAVFCVKNDATFKVTSQATDSHISQLGSIPESPSNSPSFGISATGEVTYSPYDLLPSWMKTGASNANAATGDANEIAGAGESGVSATGQMFGGSNAAQGVSSAYYYSVGAAGGEIIGTQNEGASSDGMIATGNLFGATAENQSDVSNSYYSSSSASSFGPLSATGMQTSGLPIGGAGATDLLTKYSSKATAQLQQVVWSIEALKALREGKTFYRRSFIVQPGLEPEKRCPAADPVMPRKTTLNRALQTTKLIDKPIVGDPWPYFTSEGTIEPTNATMHITIYNSSGGIAPGCLDITKTVDDVSCASVSPPVGCYVDCRDVPFYADAGYNIDGKFGRFSYSYSAPKAGQYRVVVRSSGSVGTVKGGTFVIQNRTAPSISGLPTTICSLPNEVLTLAPTLTEPTVGLGSSYNISVDVSSVSGDVVDRTGWVPARVGLVGCFGNGTCSRQSTLRIDMQPAQTLPLALESNISADTMIRVLVRDAAAIVGGVRAEQTVLHKVVDRVMPNFDVVAGTVGQASATTAGQSFDFQLRLKNNIAQGCQPTVWFLTKERPSAGWAVWFNRTTEPAVVSTNVASGNTTSMTLHVLPTAFDSIKTFPIYTLASENVPTKFVDTQAATAAQFMASDGIVVWYAGADKRIRFADITSGSISERGTVSEAISGIAADWGTGGNIYWISGGKIWQSSKSAFTPTAVVKGLSAAARGLVIDGGMLYWIDGGAIKRVIPSTAMPDCSTGCTFVANIGTAFALTADNTKIYWSGDFDVFWVSKGAVSGINLADAIASKVGGRMWTNKFAVGIAAGSASGISGVWAGLVPDANAATGKVVQLRANATGDDIFGVNTGVHDDVYAVGQDFPKAVAVDWQWVYWIDRSGDVWRVQRDTLSDYATVYYQYNPGAPMIDVRPSIATAPAGTPVTYTLTMTNGATVPIGFALSLVTAVPTGWTVSGITPTNGTLGPAASATAVITLTPPVNATADASAALTVRSRVPNSDLISEATIAYNVSNHSYPGLIANAITPTTTSPGKAVWWLLNVTNNDPTTFVIPANITLDVLNAPANWTLKFCTGGSTEERIATCRKVDTVQFTLDPTNSSDVLLFVQSSKRAADGPHTFTVRAAIGGLATVVNVTYNVFGCGNQICDPERGEYDATAQTWCEPDCRQGYSDFRCLYAGSGEGLNWWECDRTRSNSTSFGSYVSTAIDTQSLSAVRVRVCKRGTTVDECRASAICGITRPSIDSPDVIIGNCIAEMSKGVAGVFGPIYEGNVMCPSDAEGEYYLLYTGRNGTTIQPDGSIGMLVTWTSANFTFECPRYGVTEAYWLINDPVNGYKRKFDDCRHAYDIYAGAYGPGSVCAQVTLQACNLRRAHLDNLTTVFTNPSGLGFTQARAIIDRTPTVEARLDALAAQCIGLPVLDITSIRIPGR